LRDIDIAFDEAGVEPGLLLQHARCRDGPWREVEAHATGTPACEAQRVDADVALEMRNAQARNVADLVVLDVMEIVFAAKEGIDAIAAGLIADVDVGAVVPVQAVLREKGVGHCDGSSTKKKGRENPAL
jgi:hypothetical protein